MPVILKPEFIVNNVPTPVKETARISATRAFRVEIPHCGYTTCGYTTLSYVNSITSHQSSP